MTPDDKRPSDEEIGRAIAGLIGIRLNYERQGATNDALELVALADKVCRDYGRLKRLLDEATAERDAAMAALRELTTMLRVRPDMASLIGPRESAIFYHAEAVLAAHSAATKPTEVQE